jgi:hypothetical protein
MGNWRTVHIDGSIDQSQVDAARKACLHDWESNADDQPYHALSYSKTPSLCGLHEWPATRINVVGNCAERDYSVEDVAEALREVQKAAPSLQAKVHCGGDYENKACVATITVAAGQVTVGTPEVREIPEINQDLMMGRLFQALRR